MAVSYKKLFKILIDRDMKKKEFRDFVGISYSTMSKLEKGENTTVEVLEKICLKLGCGINDIILMAFLDGVTLTVKGLEYLDEHSAAMRAYKGLKELRDWLPF